MTGIRHGVGVVQHAIILTLQADVTHTDAERLAARARGLVGVEQREGRAAVGAALPGALLEVGQGVEVAARRAAGVGEVEVGHAVLQDREDRPWVAVAAVGGVGPQHGCETVGRCL